MNNNFQHINFHNFKTQSGHYYDIPLTYEVFGKPLFSAPIILVNHALTGNSTVAGKEGWWNKLIGENEVIDLNKYTVIAFNIPGNGYNDFFIKEPEDFVTRDIARIFLEGLKALKIDKLFAIIGGSLGGAIGWEMLNIKKDFAQVFVPVATDWKTTDWLYAECLVQSFLLNQEENPLQKARIHAMLCYRTPESLNKRFGNKIDKTKGIRLSEDWLNFHGDRLNQRFTLSAYKMMNRLLSTIDTVPVDEVSYQQLAQIEAEIHIISVDSDLYFPNEEDSITYQNIKKYKNNITHSVITSIHGHDAFLMEYEQLNKILQKIF